MLKEKVVVFESDDWGSIRMPSRAIYNELVADGYPLISRPFERYDCIESDDDLTAFYEVLARYKDVKGNNPQFTFNFIMANPDFDRMESDRFEAYSKESFTDTYRRYPRSRMVRSLLDEGIASKLIFPQLHGREHFQVHRWMERLMIADSDERKVFSKGMVGIPSKKNPDAGNQLMIAFEFDNEQQRIHQVESISESTAMFERIFGHSSKSFIAPVYTWHDGIEESLSKNKVEFIQGGIKQRLAIASGRVKQTRHFLMEKNSLGQHYLVRNVFFEPAVNPNQKDFTETMRYISAAFAWRKPAIISSHRLNYIGSIDERNRKDNLLLLSNLLRSILKKWPDVLFMNTVQLATLLKTS